MARNSERAMLLLNRWQVLSQTVARGAPLKRAPKPSSVASLAEAEYWRNSQVRELSGLLAEIQNSLLGEDKLREMNELINRLAREKLDWEKRIVELGGTDYRNYNDFITKNCVFSLAGEAYYGAAKSLLKPHELMHESEKVKAPSRHELAERIDASYFGFNDEVVYSGLVAEEQQREAALFD